MNHNSFYRRFRDRVIFLTKASPEDKLFWSLQKWMFSLLVTGVAINLFYQLVESGFYKFPDIFGKALSYLLAWSILSLALIAVWYGIIKFLNLDCFLYYQVWLGWLFPQLYDRRGPKTILRRFMKVYSSNELARRWDIIESRAYEKLGKRRPVFIRREHLLKRRFWPGWTFASVVIFENAPRICRKNGKITLSVDLCNEHFGIYNNTGKVFLKHQYWDNDSQLQKHCWDTSEEVHNKLLSARQDQDIFTSSPYDIRGIPLRWASGGFLPIVSMSNKTWCLVYFRDIPPIGWNVANGASEKKDEYKDLYKLIAREFSEECIVLANSPTATMPVTLYTFSYVGPYVGRRPLLSEDFAQKHWQLRFEHDGISLNPNQLLKNINWRHTPFQVEVTYHRPDLRTTQTELVENVIFTINPLEFGIEVIWICEFNLEEQDYCLDGEYHLYHEFLIRRPVAMFDLSWLKDIFRSEQSLGERLYNDANYLDCKQLPFIPSDKIRIFDKDIELRRCRLKSLQKRSSHLTENERIEERRISQWLQRYEKAFEQIKKDKVIQDPDLRTLCPVTWKSLEILFAYGII